MTINIGILEERPIDRALMDAEKREGVDLFKHYHERLDAMARKQVTLEQENQALIAELNRLRSTIDSIHANRLDVRA